MPKYQGLSLIEVLISLSIFSLSILALLKHEWQQTKAYQYYQKQVLAEQTLDDACEILLLQFELPSSLQQRVINTNSR